MNKNNLAKNRAKLLLHKPVCPVCLIYTADWVHHIDNARIDHSLANLLPVCRYCHKKTFHSRHYDKNLLIRLPSELKQRIVKFAKDQNTTVSNIFRTILRTEIKAFLNQ